MKWRPVYRLIGRSDCLCDCDYLKSEVKPRIFFFVDNVFSGAKTRLNGLLWRKNMSFLRHDIRIRMSQEYEDKRFPTIHSLMKFIFELYPDVPRISKKTFRLGRIHFRCFVSLSESFYWYHWTFSSLPASWESIAKFLCNCFIESIDIQAMIQVTTIPTHLRIGTVFFVGHIAKESDICHFIFWLCVHPFCLFWSPTTLWCFLNAGTVFLPESPLHHISIKEASSF